MLAKYLNLPIRVLRKIINEIYSYFRFTNKDRQYFDNIKGIHSGKRGFVICNGPSLNMADLELLIDEISIASNKIYLSFDSVKWRPDYVTVSDTLVWKKINNIVEKYFDTILIPNYLPRYEANNVIYWKRLRSKRVKLFSECFSDGAYEGSTVTYENLQLAVHLGLNPIYLIGCDHYYPGEGDSQSGDPVIQSDHQSHFIKGYRAAGEVVMPANIKAMDNAFSAAYKYSKENNIQIYNATRNGHLEVFDRIDFDSIFDCK